MITMTVLALVVQSLAPYIFWPSRWNVPAHASLGFCITGYIVPGFFTDVWSVANNNAVETYFYINFFGTMAMLAGMSLGFFSPYHQLVTRKLKFVSFPTIDFQKIKRRTLTFAIIGTIGIALAYVIMGFIPMFAADPLSAKQFKGEYYEPYHRAAYLFRFSFSIMVAVIPIVLSIWWVTKKKIYMWLALVMIALLLVSLARGASLIGVLMFVGFLAARKRSTAVVYIIMLGVLFPFVSAAYLIIGLLTGIERFSLGYSMDSLASIIASGSPDIADQLTFIEGFLRTTPWTYGRTFIGGLFPNNYMWNPSVWTLTYDRLGADISEIVTGGLRLTLPMWGYVSFSWIGVLMLPLLSGFVSGVFLRSLKNFDFNASLISSALVLTLYSTIGRQMIDFYGLSIHNIPSIAVILFICFGSKTLKAIFFPNTKTVGETIK